MNETLYSDPFCYRSEKPEAFYGKEIRAVALDDDEDEIVIVFMDSSAIIIRQEGQCCETRYFKLPAPRTDTLPLYWKLMKIEVRQGEDVPDKSGEHETAYLDIVGERETFRVTAHNEHNGYYGGFSFTITSKWQ